MLKVLFVCLGNICRSPTAHGVFLQKIDKANLTNHVSVDSCGTAAWHTGKQPDSRSIAAGKRRGYKLDHLVARQLDDNDFHEFDYILAMDQSNLEDILSRKPQASRAHISLLLDYSPFNGYSEVPDPYYGGDKGFDIVIDLIETACDELIKDIADRVK